MTLLTLVNTVKRKSHRGSQSITTDQITTDIIACVNEAFRDVFKLLPKRNFWKTTTVAVTSGVAGTPAVYSLASDVQEPIGFWYSLNNSYYKLAKIQSDTEWMQSVWNPNEAINTPLYYRELGPNSSTGYKQIEIFPIANASITLNYEYYKTKSADKTVADIAAELTDIPDYLIDVVEKGAYYYFIKGFDDPAAEIAKSDYEQAKLSFEIADESNRDQLPAFRFQRRRYQVPGFRLD